MITNFDGDLQLLYNVIQKPKLLDEAISERITRTTLLFTPFHLYGEHIVSRGIMYIHIHKYIHISNIQSCIVDYEFDMHSNWRDASHFKLKNVVFSELIVNAFALTISQPIYYCHKINDTFYILSLLFTAFLFIYILTYNALTHDVHNVKRFSFSKCKSIQAGKIS